MFIVLLLLISALCIKLYSIQQADNESEIIEIPNTSQRAENTFEIDLQSTNFLTNIKTYHNNTNFILSEDERKIVECMVMGEAGGETYNGKVLVAQCILNACVKDNIQPSEVRIKYQYIGWNNTPTDEVKRAVSAVFDDGYKLTNEPILYFYAPRYSNSSWHESLRHIITEGNHKFFALWG